jgi:hypothetical protein
MSIRIFGLGSRLEMPPGDILTRQQAAIARKQYSVTSRPDRWLEISGLERVLHQSTKTAW